MNWDKFDELFASMARPWVIIANGTALAFSVVWSAMYAHDLAIIVVPAATTVISGAAYLRTLDKQTAAKASTEDKKTAADAGASGASVLTEPDPKTESKVAG